jgi:hypothetical protein
MSFVHRKSSSIASRSRLARAVSRLAAGLLAVALTWAAAPEDAQAQNLIKRPGAHNRYTWELEPQLVLRPGTPYIGPRGRGYGWGYYGWAGVGPGIRVNIPFMHNGPIDTINNNIGISFGASTTWHPVYASRDAVVLNLPVAFQWNFYFTDIISVIGEVGLNTPVTFWSGYTRFWVEPLFQGGGRFQFGKVGVVVRVGWPVLSVGANFQF